MKAFRILAQVGIASALLVAAIPASAQFFPDPGFYQPPQQRYYQQPDPYYQDQNPYQSQPRYYRQRRQALGNACYTTRGSCYINYAAPVSSRCRCDIPGFGTKHGSVIQQ